MASSVGAAPSVPKPQRDELWQVSFETYYDSYFEEIMADALINRWGRLDDFTKIIVALTASGSAISGWALWGTQGWKFVWVACSGIAALLSIIHTALNVPDRIKAHADDKRRFAQIRTTLETFRYQLRVQPFDPDLFSKEFINLRKTYSDDVGLRNSDTFRTRRFEINIQKHLNEQLKDQIE